jgi:hypothetical protein
VLLAAATGLGLAVPSLAASAGTVPAQARSHHGLRFEHFTITAADNQDGLVQAQGPVRGTASDAEKTPTLGVFDFGGHNTVNVRHTDVNNIQPSRFDYRACAAFAFAAGRWQFDGGTGRYRDAFGTGRFRFVLTLIFARHRDGRCVIGPRTQPAHVRVFADATGLATAGHGGR